MKRLAARKHLEENTAEGEHIAALIRGTAPGLLRRHVCGGPEDHTGIRASHRQRGRIGHRGVRRGPFKYLRESEIENFHLAIRSNLHVSRLEIAMDHALLVSSLQRLADAFSNVQSFIHGK